MERILSHRLHHSGRKSKVEYFNPFIGYGPEHNVWQDDVKNCMDLVRDHWATKPESECLMVVLFPRTCAHAGQIVHTQGADYFSLLVTRMLHESCALFQLDPGHLMQLSFYATLSASRDSMGFCTCICQNTMCLCEECVMQFCKIAFTLQYPR